MKFDEFVLTLIHVALYGFGAIIAFNIITGILYDYFCGDWSVERHIKTKELSNRQEPSLDRKEPTFHS